MIRILIVDDSGFMRLALKKMLQNTADCNIVGEACNAHEAIRMANQLQPDIITMDIEMPGGSGIEATKTIMAQSPTAIIMVSSLTNIGAEATFEALKQGAVDFIPKASSFVSLDIASIEKELQRKVHYWHDYGKSLHSKKKDLNALTQSTISNGSLPYACQDRDIADSIHPRIIVIGASTGGPKVIPELFLSVDNISIPIVIALHMPELYTESFARNMALRTGHKVVEGKDGMTIDTNMIVIAPGGKDSEIMADNKGGFRLKVSTASKQYAIHPSVDCLFYSAISASKKIAAVVLTGMGNDGLAGAGEIRRFHMPVVVQNEESCLVYGMPRAIIDSQLATGYMDTANIAKQINTWQKSSLPNNRASLTHC